MSLDKIIPFMHRTEKTSHPHHIGSFISPHKEKVGRKKKTQTTKRLLKWDDDQNQVLAFKNPFPAV